jgi:hypothetical protein
MRLNRESRRSGVLACHSPSEAGDTAEESPPYPAWPELEHQQGMYTLPTMVGFYFPAPAKEFKESFEEVLIRFSPHLEPYKTQLIPMILEYCQSQFGTELKGSVDEVLARNYFDVYRAYLAISTNLLGDIEGIEKEEWRRQHSKALDLGHQTVFSSLHETEHRMSIAINRPATKELKDISVAIFNLLLQQADTDKYDGFLIAFEELNNKLMDCLSLSLYLEELRATVHALDSLTPEFQQLIIDKVYPQDRDDRESQIFHELRTLTSNRWGLAWFLTVLVEYLNPADPPSELEKLLSALSAKNAHTWSDENWADWVEKTEFWVDSKTELEEAATFFEEVLVDPQKLVESVVPSTLIIGMPNGYRIYCTDDMAIELFLESMRQQLANPNLIRRLICPFKGRRRSCCGFGRYLRGIWVGIPKEERRRLKPPSMVCLNYTKG